MCIRDRVGKARPHTDIVYEIWQCTSLKRPRKGKVADSNYTSPDRSTLCDCVRFVSTLRQRGVHVCLVLAIITGYSVCSIVLCTRAGVCTFYLSLSLSLGLLIVLFIKRLYNYRTHRNDCNYHNLNNSCVSYSNCLGNDKHISTTETNKANLI